MAAAADVVGVRLRRERGEQAVAGLGHAADRVAQPQLPVGRGEGVGAGDRDLLLARPVLVDRLLDLDALLAQRLDDVVDDRGGPVEAR
jgi:hypothetical protein